MDVRTITTVRVGKPLKGTPKTRTSKDEEDGGYEIDMEEDEILEERVTTSRGDVKVHVLACVSEKNMGEGGGQFEVGKVR